MLEWPDNVKVGAAPPHEYFPAMFEQHVSKGDADKVRFWHALPDGWEDMSCDAFLEARRKLMAQLLRDGFERLASGADPFATTAPEPPPTVAELVEQGESLEVESSVFHSFKPEMSDALRRDLA